MVVPSMSMALSTSEQNFLRSRRSTRHVAMVRDLLPFRILSYIMPYACLIVAVSLSLVVDTSMAGTAQTAGNAIRDRTDVTASGSDMERDSALQQHGHGSVADRDQVARDSVRDTRGYERGRREGMERMYDGVREETVVMILKRLQGDCVSPLPPSLATVYKGNFR